LHLRSAPLLCAFHPGKKFLAAAFEGLKRSDARLHLGVLRRPCKGVVSKTLIA
jgi:hypothetical protein